MPHSTARSMPRPIFGKTTKATRTITIRGTPRNTSTYPRRGQLIRRMPVDRPQPTKNPMARPRAAEPTKSRNVLAAPTAQNATERGKRTAIMTAAMRPTIADAAKLRTMRRPVPPGVPRRRRILTAAGMGSRVNYLRDEPLLDQLVVLPRGSDFLQGRVDDRLQGALAPRHRDAERLVGDDRVDNRDLPGGLVAL